MDMKVCNHIIILQSYKVDIKLRVGCKS